MRREGSDERRTGAGRGLSVCSAALVDLMGRVWEEDVRESGREACGLGALRSNDWSPGSTSGADSLR